MCFCGNSPWKTRSSRKNRGSNTIEISVLLTISFLKSIYIDCHLDHKTNLPCLIKWKVKKHSSWFVFLGSQTLPTPKLCSRASPAHLQVEQLHKIFKLCGSPPDDYWNKSRLPHATLFRPQQPYNTSLRDSFRELPPSTVDLIETLLSIEPHKRGTASTALASEVKQNIILSQLILLKEPRTSGILDGEILTNVESYISMICSVFQNKALRL